MTVFIDILWHHHNICYSAICTVVIGTAVLQSHKASYNIYPKLQCDSNSASEHATDKIQNPADRAKIRHKGKTNLKTAWRHWKDSDNNFEWTFNNNVRLFSVQIKVIPLRVFSCLQCFITSSECFATRHKNTRILTKVWYRGAAQHYSLQTALIKWVRSIIMNQDLLMLTRAFHGEEMKCTSCGSNDWPAKNIGVGTYSRLREPET